MFKSTRTYYYYYVIGCVEKEYYLCRCCRQRAYKAVKEILDLFENKGSNILAMINEEGEEIPLSFVPEGKTQIKWTCSLFCISKSIFLYYV